jgi:hypothetical protein
MKPTTPKLVIALLALALSLPVNANIILSIEPASQAFNSASSVSVDLVISGLGDHTSPSLGAFDLALSYDPSVLSAVSVTFGTQLGMSALAGTDLGTPGTIHLDDVSLRSASFLQANQPSSFTLATLSFRGIGGGSSAIELTAGTLSDETGLIPLQFSTTPGKAEVPVPDATSTGSSLALGLLSLFALSRQGGKLPWKIQA